LAKLQLITLIETLDQLVHSFAELLCHHSLRFRNNSLGVVLELGKQLISRDSGVLSAARSKRI